MKLLNETDIKNIREALRKWKKPEEVVKKYDDKYLGNQIEAWKKFVSMEWHTGMGSKYAVDVTVRYWLQVVIESATTASIDKIQKAIDPYDEMFKSKMIPQQTTVYAAQTPLRGSEYFWETHTILH